MNLRTVPATLLVGGLTLVLTAGLGWLFLIGPVLGEIGNADQARGEAEDRNSQTMVQLAQLRKQAEDLPRTEKAADELTAIFPATADQPAFFAEVTTAATDAGISPDDITAVSPGVPQIVDPAAAADDATSTVVTGDEVAIQKVTVSATGDYTQLNQLMSGLELMDRAFLVRSVDLTASEGEDAGEYTLTLEGATFVAPPLGPAPAPEA